MVRTKLVFESGLKAKNQKQNISFVMNLFVGRLKLEIQSVVHARVVKIVSVLLPEGVW